MTEFDMVSEFNKKFGLIDCEKPGWPKNENMATRMRHLDEEHHEFRKAVALDNLPKAFDALIDLVYVALGTAAVMGLPFNEGFEAVHKANMKKERAKYITKRGSTFDVIKPEGWKHANLKEIVNEHSK